MIDWTDEAIEAAIDAFYEGSDMRAALDAAVQAQGSIYAAFCREAVQEARAEALEEAARVAEVFNHYSYVQINSDGTWGPGSPYDRGAAYAAETIAIHIRALKETKG